ncbi:hypothetical protein GL982_11655 (plasmid) [Spiroplasma citri]|uniref:Plectrovirus-related protein n=2 Tax=Spiroplasma citri TaxID=2133 RepID=A0AAJ4EJG2_SPICI|nr:hypothetical protein [Spiroplasma citri]APE74777.1 plectrovirus-related protein [Spiroplasma citri]QIA68838.1 hypothetical protein GL298_04545 [Spiroplasma citri]QIA70702.1 hypothetical protein GL981_04575 [Spiroplasma citri]QIA74182.1 hypothetical protein GL982_11655 [Spiroplasma citri]QIA74954.1 hypothetical protein GTU57_04260 [Spiroplasma citri]
MINLLVENNNSNWDKIFSFVFDIFLFIFDVIWNTKLPMHPVIEVQQINSERSWFFIEKKHYFILRSLVIKYGKDIVINTVNKIVINNVKENE